MKNKDKQYFIPVDGELVEVTEEVYRAYYQPIWNTRYHAQKNGECRCTKAQLWKCDGICPGCPYYAAGKKVSIDTPIGGEDDDLTLGDTLTAGAPSPESKRLAHKMIRVAQASQSQEGGNRYEQNERDGCHHQRTAGHCCFY